MTILRIDLDHPEEYDIYRMDKMLEALGGRILEINASYTKGLHITAELDYAMLCAYFDILEDYLSEFKEDIIYAKKLARRIKLKDPLAVIRIALGDDIRRIVLDEERRYFIPQQVLFSEHETINIEVEHDE